MNIVIIEDEAIAAERLYAMLKKIDENVNLPRIGYKLDVR